MHKRRKPLGRQGVLFFMGSLKSVYDKKKSDQLRSDFSYTAEAAISMTAAALVQFPSYLD